MLKVVSSNWQQFNRNVISSVIKTVPANLTATFLTCTDKKINKTLSIDRRRTKRSATMPIQPIVLSGPSGGGKTTMITRAMKEFPGIFAFSVSHTTRSPRNGEENGIHYYFLKRPDMERMIESGEFLEFAEFGGNMYGTSLKQVENISKSGKICVLDVELQGVRNLKKMCFDAKYILVKASLETLEFRLRARGTETKESLEKRLKHAEEDLEAIDRDPALFDYVVENTDFNTAYREFINILHEDIEAAQHAIKEVI